MKIRRVLCLALILAFTVTALSGCAMLLKARDVEDIYDDLKDTGKLPKMLVLEDRYSKEYYTSMIEEYIGTSLPEIESSRIAISEDPKRVDTIILVKSKDKKAVRELMDRYLVELGKQVKDASPELAEQVKNAAVGQYKDLTYLVISPEKDRFIKIITAIKK